MFENAKTFEMDLTGRKLKVVIGKYAGLANGSCMIYYGDTVVLCTATMNPKPRDVDYFPLSVDYEEKLYAVGRIPGSYIRRETRPSDKAILSSRVVDRPMRPLFPSGMRNDVSVVMTVMSVDQDNEPEIAGMIGSSIAVAISDIPWKGPIGGVHTGIVNGKIVVNPTLSEREISTLQLTVAATQEKIVMIEAGAYEIDNDTMMDAIVKSHEVIKEIISFINSIVGEVGKEKIAFESQEVDSAMYDAVKEIAYESVKIAMDTDDKTVRDAALGPIYDEVHAKLDEVYPDMAFQLDECMYKLQKYIVRRWLLDDNKRVDGRGIDQIRPLDAEVGILPRVHGSGMFTRGQTQVLTVATLAMASESQLLDGLDLEEKKRYIHHYNFPSYSVGETRPSRGPGRREIGHGALAERSLIPVLPSLDEFPYTIRLVSEVISSNGSTSQGSVCGSTLALMDAGVPLKAPVAGISCGLITENDRWMTMVDIQGVEDFFGDMDFKVAGTLKGITSIQVDIKIDGLSYDVIREAFAKTYTARKYILDEVMAKTIDKPREELSLYAPKMKSILIDVDKISAVIGKGGKTIQGIVAECEVKVDVEEDGHVFVSGLDISNVNRAINIIETIVNDPEEGAMYYGKVTRLLPIGAFVEIAPGKEGMVHISKLDIQRVANIEDVLSVGDIVPVKVMGYDDRGRLNLSRKDALIALKDKK